MAPGDEGDQARLALPEGIREGFMEKAAPDPSMDGSLLFSPSHLARFIITHLCTYLKNPGVLHYFEYAKRTKPCPPLHGQHLPHHGCFTRISGVNAQCGHAGP